MQIRNWRIAISIALLFLGLPAAAAWAQAQASVSQNRPVGVIVFDLTPDRVEPTTMSVTEGWYIIRLRNGLTLSPVAIQLNHETLGSVISTATKAGASAAQQTVQLQPGKHILSVGGQSKWTATLVVTPSK